MPPAQQQQPRREPAPPSQASPPAAHTVTAPSTRALLVTLHVTLKSWRCEELAAYAAWAAWVTAVTGAGKGKVDVRPLVEHAAACELVTELTCRVLRETAGASAEVREGVWAMARGGERLVLGLLDRTTRRRR